MILDRILQATGAAVARRKQAMSLLQLETLIPFLPPTRNFRIALAGDECSIVAEVKRSSPSAGRIIENFDPVRIARAYEEGGASAISLLTEESFFEGQLSFLSAVRRAVSLPLLRKDFIIDPYQIYETRVRGGDALLLIARVLGREKLVEFLSLARFLGLEALVEVHTREELETALSANADIIGINNRDLATFVTDLNVSAELAKFVPDGKIIVAESGIKTREDVIQLGKSGIGAFLVGESLSRSPDSAIMLRCLRGREEKQ